MMIFDIWKIYWLYKNENVNWNEVSCWLDVLNAQRISIYDRINDI